MRAVLTTVTMIAALTCVGMASDGVIEINQARALAGGVTPGDDPGFPVTINGPGSYRLTSDLDTGAGIGISVSASHVSIDLNGFSIQGNGIPVVGVFAGGVQDQDDVSVANGAIQGFSYGLQFVGQGHMYRVERIRVSGTTQDGIMVISGLVSGCTVDHAGGDGINVGFFGLVTGNVVSLSAGHGVNLGTGVGYSNNSLYGNEGGNATGGVSLGANLCGNKLCP